MKKTFIVRQYQHEAIAADRGVAVWELIDEAERPRKVTALTQLDAAGIIENAKPIYHRETPLVEQLLNVCQGESFTIDFTSFNTAQQYAPRLCLQTTGSVGNTGDMLPLFLFRVMAALGLLSVVWMFWSFIESVATFARNH
jgi:hypothetical protein